MTFPPKTIAAAACVAAAFAAGAIAIVRRAPASAAAEAASPAPDAPGAPVEVMEAVATDLAPLAEAPGAVVSRADSLVAAAVEGVAVWVAEPGDVVAAGEPIARIDPADAELALADARADVERLSRQAAYLGDRVAVFESLGEETGEPEIVLEQMRSERDQARQDLERARIALRRAETLLERTEVRAPFAGRIVARELDVGEYARPGATVARLVDTANLEVVAAAPAAIAANVAPGDTVAVSALGVTVEAPVRAVVPVGDEVSRMLELRVALDGAQWPIGTAARLSLPAAAPRRAVAVHRDALVLRADGASVFTVSDDGTARRVAIGIGAADGDLIEAIGDVSEGDLVIVRGAERLRDGQAVAIRSPVRAAS